jgi:hypothetical protein
MTRTLQRPCGLLKFFQHIIHKLNMKHLNHSCFIRYSNPVPLGQKSGALTTELPGHQHSNAELKPKGLGFEWDVPLS